MRVFDLGKAVTYVFEDPNWVKKLAIAALMIPLIFVFFIGAFILNGYVVAITRRVAADDPQPLPEWDDFGVYLVQGLTVFVGLLIWFLPAIVVGCCFGFFIGFQDSFGLSLLLNFLLSLFFSAYSALVAPLVIARFALHSTFGAMFEVGEIFSAIPKVGMGLLLVFVVSFIANIVIPISIIAFCIGIFVSAAYFTLIQGHLYGQIARVAFGGGLTAETHHPAF